MSFFIILLFFFSSSLSIIYNNSIWNSNVKVLLNNLGFSHLNFNQTHIKSYINRIEQRLHDQAIQSMNSSIANNRKLDFFRTIHTLSKRPAYLDILKLKRERSILSKFRLSNRKRALQ